MIPCRWNKPYLAWSTKRHGLNVFFWLRQDHPRWLSSLFTILDVEHSLLQEQSSVANCQLVQKLPAKYSYPVRRPTSYNVTTNNRNFQTNKSYQAVRVQRSTRHHGSFSLEGQLSWKNTALSCYREIETSSKILLLHPILVVHCWTQK